VGCAAADRLAVDVAAALRRKPANEARLAGILRALAPCSQVLRASLTDALETLVARGSYTRPLYGASARALAEAGERRAIPPLKRALLSDDAGGLATLSAACFVDDAALGEPLARVAASRHPHVAFAAELARVARGESDGKHVASLAPKIKESHRIELCSELLVPLLRSKPLSVGVTPALRVLREAERHLGRWLVFGELAARAGDPEPLARAKERAESGPSSARSAWAMVAWALGQGQVAAPSVRPTVELIARLSDRPSSDRDTTFLYRLAEARVPVARSMLEGLAKPSLANEAAIRAALYLGRDHGRDDLLEALASLARNKKREALRGLAAAALNDAGQREVCQDLALALTESKQLPTMAWGVLLCSPREADEAAVLKEPTFRRVQLGWCE
jgi:hypothetical protein